MSRTRDIISSPRVVEIKRAKRKTKIRLFVLYVIFMAVIILGLSFLSQWNKMKIDKINVIGAHIIWESDIQKKVETDISGKYFYLFSKSNAFLFPKSYIYNDLITSFTRIEKLTITRADLKTLNITLTERTGSFLWCGERIPEKLDEIGENCYFINNDGYIFDKAPYFSGNLYFKFYIPLEKSENNSPLTKQVLPKEKFISLMGFVDKITSLGFKPAYIRYNSNNTAELYLESKIGDTSPKIIFSTEAGNNDDLKQLADDFSLAMKKPEFAEEIKNNYNRLLYIDLQFKNKVLYKLQ